MLFEGTVFFERLSAHCDLVRSSSCCVSITDNSAALAMPFLLAVLQPPHAKIVADGEQDFTSCRGPLEVQRSAVMCLKGLCSSTMIPNDAFMPFEIGKTLFSFLHDRTGRRNFQHFTDQRSLALSRAVVNYFEDCQLLEAELISLISALIKVQISGREAEEQSFICMRWLLCARCLVSGDMIKPGQHFDDSEIELSIPSLIEKAKLVARCDASTALRYSNPPRWQLKCIATNVASVIMGLLLGISEANADDFSLFNYTSAQSHCNELFRKDGIRINSVQLHSCPIFHLEELVTMACSASAATSNHSELPSVQISGLRFLTSLFHAFGKQLDAATNDGASVLEQFSSQIISAVKYALKSEASRDESVSTTDFHRLFSVGCEALLVIIANGFVTDPVAMKRLLRPILLSPEEIPFAPFPTDGESGFYSISLKCGNMIDDPRSYPLFRISKLCFAARVSISIELGKIPHSTASIISGDLEQNEEGRAIHSAAAAIDGFLLHTIQRRPRDENTDGRDNIAGLTCKNYSDLDDAVVHGLVKNWPTLAAYAVTSIIKAIKSMPEEREKKDSLLAWLMKLCPIIIYGLRLTLSDFNSVQNSTSGITVSEDSSTAESLALCVYSLRLFVREHESIGNDFLCSTELCDIINILAKSVVFSFLGLPDCVDKVKSLSAGQPSSEGDCKVLMNQSCLFIEDLCRNIEVVQVDLSLLIRTVVYPLAALQEKKIKVESNNMFIVCSCIQSSQCLLRCHPEKEKGLFEKALLQLAFSILKDVSGSLVDANVPCLSLLKTCCEETSMTPEEWGQVATYTACSGLWDAWAVVCSTLPLGFGVTCSIHAVKIALADLKSSFVHTNALVALRKSLQSAAIENPAMVCSVLQCVGCEILQLLRAYSLRIVAGQDFDENRITVCAESVKVNMIAFQYLHSVSMEDSKFVSFLSAMFDVLVDCVSYNGLPNHPSGKAGADETIGKMCAQVFVHVARTTPLVFKSAMVIISVERRTILETAVRADMSGYAAPRKEPLKKKLNLKGFVR